MAKYLFQASYTAEGARGLMKEGGSKRREAVDQLVKGLGGRVEAFYYAFGDNDAFVIVELPDSAAATAASVAVNASGSVKLKTTPIFTPEEMDSAVRKGAKYRPPGQ